MRPFSLWCRGISSPTLDLVPSLSVSGGRARRGITDDVERDFKLRSIGHLQISNLRGPIVIEGLDPRQDPRESAPQGDRELPRGGQALFEALDFRYREVDGDIELSAEYGKGLAIQERLRERENPRTSMEMVISAPAGLKMRVWAVDGAVSVKGWSAPLEVRTGSGAIRIEGSEVPETFSALPHVRDHRERH